MIFDILNSIFILMKINLKWLHVCNMESTKFKDDAGIIKYIQHLHISLL